MTVSRPSHDPAASNAAPLAGRGVHATLSIVLLSTGDRHLLEASLATLSPRCRALGAEVVIVAAEPLSARDALSVHPEARFIRAPRGSSQAQLRDLGMAAASGDIVSLREDVAVGDGRWIDAFLRAVGVDASVLPADAASPRRDGPADYHDRPAERARSVDGARPRVRVVSDPTARPSVPTSHDGVRGPLPARDR